MSAYLFDLVLRIYRYRFVLYCLIAWSAFAHVSGLYASDVKLKDYQLKQIQNTVRTIDKQFKSDVVVKYTDEFGRVRYGKKSFFIDKLKLVKNVKKIVNGAKVGPLSVISAGFIAADYILRGDRIIAPGDSVAYDPAQFLHPPVCAAKQTASMTGNFCDFAVTSTAPRDYLYIPNMPCVFVNSSGAVISLKSPVDLPSASGSYSQCEYKGVNVQGVFTYTAVGLRGSGYVISGSGENVETDIEIAPREISESEVETVLNEETDPSTIGETWLTDDESLQDLNDYFPDAFPAPESMSAYDWSRLVTSPSQLANSSTNPDPDPFPNPDPDGSTGSDPFKDDFYSGNEFDTDVCINNCLQRIKDSPVSKASESVNTAFAFSGGTCTGISFNVPWFGEIKHFFTDAYCSMVEDHRSLIFAIMSVCIAALVFFIILSA